MQDQLAAAQQMMQGFESLANNMQQIKVQRLMNDASKMAMQINASELGEAEKIGQVQSLSQQVAMGLIGMGASPQQAQVAQQAIDPDADLRRQLQAAQAQMTAQSNDLIIPGLGMAINKDAAKEVREQYAAAQDSRKILQEMRQIINTTSFRKGDRQLVARVNSMRNMLVGRLRVAMVGPGPLSEPERETILSTIPDPTELFTLDSTVMAKLDVLEESAAGGIINAARRAGIPESQAAAALSRDGYNPVSIRKNLSPGAQIPMGNGVMVGPGFREITQK